MKGDDGHFILCFYQKTIMIRFIVLLCLSFLTLNCHAGTNEKGLAFLEENKSKPGVITLPSGLQYKILTKGKGTKHPTVNSPCSCHYEGKLIDGTKFDSSYDRGEPSTFAPNQVIKGWTEAMQKMVAGDKWELYIPSELGYGDRGSPPKIGGGDVLIFQMEIQAILGDTVNALTCKLDEKGCNEKEIKYIKKISDFGKDQVTAASERIQKLMKSPMSNDLREWAERRLHILGQMDEKFAGEAEL